MIRVSALLSAAIASARLVPLVALACVLGPAVSAQDQGSFGKVIRIERQAFSPDAGLITFSELPDGQRNPLYTPDRYGAGVSGVTVSFGGYFVGQQLGNSAQCPSGANRNGCVIGTATDPLRLDAGSPATFIAGDRSNPTSPSLSGTPQFNGAVSILFSKDVAGVGLAGGYFNAEKSTAITAFDRRGRTIGGVKNLALGMEYMALVTEDGAERIAGLQFSLVGAEPAGYGIDELSFAFARQIDRSQVRGLAAALANPTPEALAGGNAAPTPPAPQPAGGLTALFGSPAGVAPANPATVSPPAETPPLPPARPKPAGGLSDLFNN
jgi:hypothetical protein